MDTVIRNSDNLSNLITVCDVRTYNCQADCEHYASIEREKTNEGAHKYTSIVNCRTQHAEFTKQHENDCPTYLGTLPTETFSTTYKPIDFIYAQINESLTYHDVSVEALSQVNLFFIKS